MVCPHLLYSRFEKNRRLAATTYVVPVATFVFRTASKLNPRKRNLTVASDRDKIESLLVQLEPYKKAVRVGYEGDYVGGKRTGKGKLTSASGDVYVYEGDFMGDIMRTGVYREAAAAPGAGAVENTYAAVFSGGDDIRNGNRVYTAVLSMQGRVVREGQFSDGKFLEA